MNDFGIRAEAADEQNAISTLIAAAFLGVAHADGREHLLVDALREADALSLSLVAERGARLVGHVAFSPVQLEGVAAPEADAWYALAPVAVAPDRQRQGIGRALIETGLVALRSAGARGCVVLGDPAYYGRFGFAAQPSLQLSGVPPAYFLALNFTPEPWPAAMVRYHAAFSLFE